MKLTRSRMNQIILEEVVNLSRIDEGEEKESEKKHEIVIPEDHFRYIMKEIEKANSWTTIDWTKVGGVLMPLLGELNRMRQEEKFGGYGYKRKQPGADRPDASDRTPKEDLQQIVNDATLLHNMLGDDMELDFEIQKGIIIASNNLHNVISKMKEQKFEGSTLFRESKEPEQIDEVAQAALAIARPVLAWIAKNPRIAAEIAMTIAHLWPKGEQRPEMEDETAAGGAQSWGDYIEGDEDFNPADDASAASKLISFLRSPAGKWAISAASKAMVSGAA